MKIAADADHSNNVFSYYPRSNLLAFNFVNFTEVATSSSVNTGYLLESYILLLGSDSMLLISLILRTLRLDTDDTIYSNISMRLFAFNFNFTRIDTNLLRRFTSVNVNDTNY